MTTQDLIEHFGSKTAIAKALGIWHTTISSWGVYPPLGRQYELQVITNGKLKATKPATK